MTDGFINLKAEAAPIRCALRPFLDAMFRPRREVLLRKDDVAACPCEEVTAGCIRAVARLGRIGCLHQTKAFDRAGINARQGRQCGTTVTPLLAEAWGQVPGEIGFCRARPPPKPVKIAELTTLDAGDGGT